MSKSRVKTKEDLMKWDLRFLGLAKYISAWSKDPSTQIGAVIVDQRRRVVSVGYNGLAQGVEDIVERLENREIKYKMFLHAERNAIIFAGHKLDNCTIYTYPFMPCAACAAMVIQSGITRVVAPYSENPRWVEDFKLSMIQFAEAEVETCILNDPVVV